MDMKIIPFLIGVFATSIVVYNNMIGFFNQTTRFNDYMAFILVVFGTTTYFFINRKMIKQFK